MVVHLCDSNTGKSEAGELLQIQDQLELHNKTKTKKKTVALKQNKTLKGGGLGGETGLEMDRTAVYSALVGSVWQRQGP